MKDAGESWVSGLLFRVAAAVYALFLVWTFIRGFHRDDPYPKPPPADVASTADSSSGSSTSGGADSAASGPNGSGYYNTQADMARWNLERHVAEELSKNEIKPWENDPGSTH
jgi:hypothetical protein